MWGFTPLAGWTSRVKDTLHRIGAHENTGRKKMSPTADERLPREVRAEGRRHRELQAEDDNGNPRSPSKLRRLLRRRDSR